MTVTAIAPPLEISGPLPVEPEHSLLRTPGVLQTPAGPIDVDGDEPFSRWQSGVSVWSYPTGLPQLFEPCSSGTYRVKDDASDMPKPVFTPVAIYQPLTCSTISMGSYTDFRARALAVLQATRSYAVERVLAFGSSALGITTLNNPFLGDTNMVAPLGNGAVSPQIGLRYLENAIGSTGRAGMLHATPAVVDAWFSSPQTDEAVLRTAAGSLVACEDGLIGLDPASFVNAPAGGTKDWAFATGPVRAYVSDPILGDVASDVDQSLNIITTRAEYMVLVEWDTALQVGVLIDWSLS